MKMLFTAGANLALSQTQLIPLSEVSRQEILGAEMRGLSYRVLVVALSMS